MAKKPAVKVGLPARLDFAVQALLAYQDEGGEVNMAVSDSAVMLLLEGVAVCPNHKPPETRLGLRPDGLCSACLAEKAAEEKKDAPEKTEEKKEE
jgi:hypothetical protein